MVCWCMIRRARLYDDSRRNIMEAIMVRARRAVQLRLEKYIATPERKKQRPNNLSCIIKIYSR